MLCDHVCDNDDNDYFVVERERERSIFSFHFLFAVHVIRKVVLQTKRMY